jgi:HD-GYP domain-containing protein (c-di-GMP phosphodiesterase class II)
MGLANKKSIWGEFMLHIELQHPIHTIDNKELLPAGAILTEETLRDIVNSNGKAPSESLSLMQFSTVRKDIFEFFNNPPYKTIFDNHEDTEDVLNVMEQVILPMPVLESLEYFREYDFHTYRHMLMIFALSTLLAKILVPDYQRRIHNATAGPSHDLGKICVPVDVLLKRDPLTKDERSILFQHPVAGYVLLCYYTKDINNFSAKVARDHHERKDGSGYARGIRQRDFLVEIVAVSDVYDALISPRPYRPATFDNRTALEEITIMAQSGKIGWDVLQALVSLNRKDKPDFRNFEVSLEKRGTPPEDNSYGKTAPQ